MLERDLTFYTHPLKIALISPKTDGLIKRSYHLPIGLAYIASSLKQAGALVRFIDFETDGDARKKLDDICTQWHPEYIGLSIHALCFKSALQLVEYIRLKRTRAALVAGGIFPSTYPAVFLRDGLFDYVVRGDGEIPLLQLIQGNPPDTINGLCFRESGAGNVILRDTNYQPFQLEDLPYPDYETIPVMRYVPPFGSIFRLPSYPMLATRGCSGACTFCTSYEYNKKHRVRKPEDVLSEIEKAIVDYRAKEIRFLDACFTDNMEHSVALCNLLIRNKLPVSWHCMTRIDKLDKELLNLMKRAGCVGIGFGLESANKEVIKRIKKPYEREKAFAILQQCDELGFFIKSSFMYGLPGETDAAIVETINFALEAPADIVIFNRLNLPLMLSYQLGTPMETEFKLLERESKKLAIASLFPRLSIQRIKHYIFISYLKFYLRPSYWLRYIRKKISLVFLLNNFFHLFPNFIAYYVLSKKYRRYDRSPQK